MITRIKKLCEMNNVSFRKVESDLQFGNGTIGKWGSTDPGIGKVQKVADYFGVTLDSLCGREPLKQSVTNPELNLVLMQLNKDGVDLVTIMAKGLLSQPEYKKSNQHRSVSQEA